MNFDLRSAIIKRSEWETARAADFDFRHRARTIGRVAAALGCDAEAWVPLVAELDDAALCSRLAEAAARTLADVTRLHARESAAVRSELVAELGDPTPTTLA
jgi:hypothetical protein